MGSDANRLRQKWQDYAGKEAAAAELSFFETFDVLFRDTEYKVRRKINEFKDLYVNVLLSQEELSQIYTPPEPITTHGVRPDHAIKNIETNKTIYVEVKRQDGWVEGKTRAAGRGNAHERSCKFFTPGLQRALRKAGNLDESVIPVWTIFIGDITRDPCRVREVKLWYQGIEKYYFMWRNTKDAQPLIEHFIEHIKPLLD